MCRCKKITVKEVLTEAHFDTGLAVTHDLCVKVSVLPDLTIKKLTNKDGTKNTKTPKCFVHNTKNHISHIHDRPLSLTP